MRSWFPTYKPILHYAFSWRKSKAYPTQRIPSILNIDFNQNWVQHICLKEMQTYPNLIRNFYLQIWVQFGSFSRILQKRDLKHDI